MRWRQWAVIALVALIGAACAAPSAPDALVPTFGVPTAVGGETGPIVGHATMAAERDAPYQATAEARAGPNVIDVEDLLLRIDGEYATIDGVVKNVSARTVCFVELSFRLTGAGGQTTGVAATFANNTNCLGPGDEGIFSRMTNAPGTTRVELINVTWQPAR